VLASHKIAARQNARSAAEPWHLNYDYAINLAAARKIPQLQMKRARFLWEMPSPCSICAALEPQLTTLRLIKEECVLGAASTRRLKLFFVCFREEAGAPSATCKHTAAAATVSHEDLSAERMRVQTFPRASEEKIRFHTKKKVAAHCEKGYTALTSKRRRQLMKLQLC
jgi:hypothetical protein